jgi:hypothetical protein
MDGDERTMQPEYSELINRMGLKTPLIGIYDSPFTSPFEPFIKPGKEERSCIFAYYTQWLDGKTLHLTQENPGCRGAGCWIFSTTTRSREDFISFLVDDEGLKASHELMDVWLEHNKPYMPENPNILIGPLKADQYDHLKTITFYVNPDQLSALMLGAQYNEQPGGFPSVISPFGSGCMQMLSLFEDLNIPQAIIGATDIAFRQYLPPDVLSFTVTKPMFEQLCNLDNHSFLYKRFWKRLLKARGISI